MTPLSGNSSDNQQHDFFQAFDTFESGSGRVGIYRLSRLEEQGLCRVADLPFSIRVMLESVLRQCDGKVITEEHVKHLAAWQPKPLRSGDIPFKPARVILQDFTGVPAIVDLAAMRAAMKRLGGDPRRINPLVPVDLVIDHSVQVDRFASDDALQFNVELEFHRNRERYEFLRWGQKAFDNFRVVPPETGIVHQVNLEYLSKCVLLRNMDGRQVALPDTLVGTDSHTTMINGLGIVGWGVGGIEAEAAMLGQPLYMLTPEVLGFELVGKFLPGVTATDLVLTVAQMLRKHGVVGRFVEFFGSGLANLQTADRATIGNMSPEYGATIAYFPIDDETLHYLRSTGRTEDEVQLVERYAKEQGLFHTDGMPQPKYSDCLKLDLATVEPSLSGPKRPHDRVALASLKQSFADTLRAPIAERGFALKGEEISRKVPFSNGAAGSLDHAEPLGHGSVVIAAITSCTNTSNPTVMLAAGLLAKKAVEKGLHSQPHVKTSLAPGSRVVSDYLDRAGLTQPLKALGFHTVGYGCTTCIGNSGPLPEKVAKAVTDGSLVAAAVLSGNRNFEGRIHSLVKANYLASPPLVVAFALAGRIDIDLTTEPLGLGRDGQPVYLRDLWPAPEEVARVREQTVLPEMFRERYSRVFEGNERWNELKLGSGDLYDWDEESAYIQEPPFFIDLPKEPAPIGPLHGARVLALLGDSITTDHISPAGAIAQDGPAGRYLQERGVEPREFNSYGSRRGNDRVMTRGTFANVRIRNQLAPGTEGGLTRHLPDGEVVSIFDASVKYRAEGVPLVILAGTEYGSGSSRDWAAKGTNLLGVRAVIAASYERIHRSNLVGMGILPLQFRQGETWQSLGLTGEEVYDISDLGDEVKPLDELTVTATAADGTRREFAAVVRVESPIEIAYYRHGGILQAMLREMLNEG